MTTIVSARLDGNAAWERAVAEPAMDVGALNIGAASSAGARLAKTSPADRRIGGLRLVRNLASTTALAVFALALLLSGAATPAFANGGAGGRGNTDADGNSGGGVAGGTDSLTNVGNPGNPGSNGTIPSGGGGHGGGGGGGGGGAGFPNGGDGGNGGNEGGESSGGGNGGLGGFSGGPDAGSGAHASDGGGGGGGGGGRHGFVGNSLPSFNPRGGNGGDGGHGSHPFFFSGRGGGGGGGAGGYGAVVTGSVQLGTTSVNINGGTGGTGGTSGGDTAAGGAGGQGGTGGVGIRLHGPRQVTVGASSTITGGTGGNGGDVGEDSDSGTNGDGGTGGAGLVFTITDSPATMTNNGKINGGTGGNAGEGGQDGHGGDGESGAVFLGDIMVNNSGTIKGGNGGAVSLPTSPGALSGAGGNGVTLGNGANLTNNHNGKINGGTGGDNLTGNGEVGGSGAVLLGGILTNHGTLTGGTGGNGETDFTGGNGGNGGNGVSVNGGGTVINSQTINGGTGGTGGNSNGAGGSGVSVNGGTLINNGTINAGNPGGGSGTSGDAITFGGGTNRLEVWSHSNIVGNADATTGGDDTLALGGTDNGTFGANWIGATQQYRGFENFEKTGTSTWTLAGSGNQDWLIDAGTLIGDTDSLGGNLTFATGASGADVVFDQQADGTYAGTISGPGTMTKQGAGTLTFSGANSYTGGTTVDDGTLQAGSAGALPNNTPYTVNSGTLNLNDHNLTMSTLRGTGGEVVLGSAQLTVNQSTSTTYAGAITGSGSLTKTGTGRLTLTGDNTYSGGTTINGGTLRIGDGGTSGSITGDVLNNGRLVFNRSGDLTYAGDVSGSGALAKAGSGRLTLTGDNTYTGVTIIESGTLRIGNGGTSGSITGNVLNNGRLVFNRSGDLTYAGGVSGTGTLTKSGDGTLTLTGNNTYTGGTTINGGTLQIGDGGTSGSITGNVLNNSVLAFDRSGELTYAGAVSGTGALTKSGDGTLTLTGTNTYTGGTTIEAGTLQIGDGGTSGSIVGNVTNNGTLAFNRSNNLTYGGVISGDGALQQNGAGTTNLTSANTYTGDTTITGGTLLVNGSITSDTFVEAGGTLGGTGTIVGNVTNSGIVAPGNSIGTLPINGNYVGTGGMLLVEAELGSDPSPTDLLLVTGDVSGNTFVRVVDLGGSGVPTTGNGILIVDVGGTSTPDAFTLAGPVRAGAYDYGLFQGGGGDPDDWFLRTTGLRPTTAVYTSIPPLAQEYGARVLGTLHRRVGAQEQLRCRGDLANCPYNNGGWGRVIGVTGDRAPGNPDKGATFGYDLWAVQAGRDLYRRQYADGSREHAGLYFAGGGASADVLQGGGTHGGDIWFGGYSLGGYWTWYGANQWYLDTVLQSTWYDVRATTVDGDRIEPPGWGGAVSLEGGYPLLVRRGWILQPQAQLLYQGLNFGTVQDADSTVSFSDDDSLRGRVGLRLVQTWRLSPRRDGAPRLLTVALTGDAWREFEGDNVTTHATLGGNNPLDFRADLGGSWGEIGGDATAQLNRYTSLYGSGQYSRGFDGNRDAWTGSVGLRVNW